MCPRSVIWITRQPPIGEILKKIEVEQIKKIKNYRRSGYSYNEISRLLGISVGAIYKYSSIVKVSKDGKERLKNNITTTQNKFVEKFAKRKQVHLPSLITPELVRIIGHCFFDGSVSLDSISYSNVSTDLIKQFIQDMEHVFGIQPSSIISYHKKSTCYQLWYHYKSVSEYIRTFAKNYSTSSKECNLLPKSFFNKYGVDAHIFLRTFWEDEGSVKANGDVTAKTKREIIAKQLQSLHNMLDIKTRLYYDKKNDAYEIYICRSHENLTKFINLIGFRKAVVCRGKFRGLTRQEAFSIVHKNIKFNLE